MNDLRREIAPISAAAWGAIDEEAKRVLELSLTARQLVDFVGPLGWEASAVNAGRVRRIDDSPAEGIEAALREVQPLVELRASFELARDHLDDVDRGRKDPDLSSLTEAALRIGRAEDSAVFNGYATAGIRGLCKSSPHRPLTISENYERYAGTVAEATRILRNAGIGGPYAIALGPRCYAGLLQATGRGGYPVYELVRRMLDGPAVWAPAIEGAVVLSTRGGDYELTVGRDLSIGYSSHNEKSARFYLVESLTFRVHTPEAAVPLTYGS